MGQCVYGLFQTLWCHLDLKLKPRLHQDAQEEKLEDAIVPKVSPPKQAASGKPNHYCEMKNNNNNKTTPNKTTTNQPKKKNFLKMTQTPAGESTHVGSWAPHTRKKANPGSEESRNKLAARGKQQRQKENTASNNIYTRSSRVMYFKHWSSRSHQRACK